MNKRNSKIALLKLFTVESHGINFKKLKLMFFCGLMQILWMNANVDECKCG